MCGNPTALTPDEEAVVGCSGAIHNSKGECVCGSLVLRKVEGTPHGGEVKSSLIEVTIEGAGHRLCWDARSTSPEFGL